jgi:hypothetical protein
MSAGREHPEVQLVAGRTEDLSWEAFDEQCAPLVIAPDDLVRYKLSATLGGAPAAGLDLVSGSTGPNGSAVTIESIGKSLTPEATGADTITLTGHSWATGTPVYALATDAGLEAGVAYFVRAIDANTVSVHRSLGDAQADVSRVDLTASVKTPLIEPARGRVRLAQADTQALVTTAAAIYFDELLLVDSSETSPADATKPIVYGSVKLRPPIGGSTGQ